MDPAEKNRSIEFIYQHDGLSPAYVLSLESKFIILWIIIQSRRVCYEVSMLNVSQIDSGIPMKEKITSVVDGKDFAAKIQIQDAAYQIDNYHINPPNKKLMDILNQIIQFRNKNKKSYWQA